MNMDDSFESDVCEDMNSYIVSELYADVDSNEGVEGAVYIEYGNEEVTPDMEV